MEINGVAHVMLTVSNFETCLPFYEKLTAFLGLKPVIRSNDTLYCVGGRTALCIVRADDAHRSDKFAQRRVGLHHVCFRARERGDIDNLHAFGGRTLGARLLLSPVRRSRRHQAGSESRPWQRPARVG